MRLVNWLRKILGIERLEHLMSNATDEVAAIKADLVDYQAKVANKIADLQAQIDALKASGSTVPAELQAALDDLKATADGLSIPS